MYWWAKAKLVFLREVRDQLRDYRTMFMIVVLPVLLYPALGFGLTQIAQRFGQQSRKVGISGAEFLPSKPPLLSDGKDFFHNGLFHRSENQRYYQVSCQRDDGSSWSAGDLRAGRIDALIVIPPDADARLSAGGQVVLSVLRDGANDNSEVAYQASKTFLESWETKIVAERMRRLGKSTDFADPIQFSDDASDVTADDQRTGTLWSKLLPFILVMMALTGAFYPAIDLCAGEKERGTMETLLITPAARAEIVAGKFLTIFVFSLATTVFNLASMGLTFGQISRMIQVNSDGAAVQFAPPSFSGVGWMLVLMIPLAAFFSAVAMALAVFARSTKEGQYYLTPMFMITTPLVFLTLAPGVELSPFFSLVPVTNVALLLRAFMLNQYELAGSYFFFVLVPTLLYAYLALRFALEQFKREEVLFRSAERFELRLWLRRLLTDKQPSATGPQAWCLYILMLLLNWHLQGHLPSTPAGAAAVQLLVFGFPTLVMGLMLTSDARHALALRIPDLWPAILAVLLAFTLHPVVIAAHGTLQRWMPVSDDLRRAIEKFIGASSLSEQLLLIALLPAIFEELAFRGFILSGLLRKNPPYRAIAISAILFGVIHMIPQQMVNATFLGLVLGLIATRSGSVLPGMLFHGLNNAMALIYNDSLKTASTAEPVGHSQLLVLMGALASAVLIALLIALPSRLGAAQKPSASLALQTA